MTQEIKLTSTGSLLAKCWQTAEEQLRSSIGSKHRGANEEQITFLLQGELRTALDEANSRGLFGQSFVADLIRGVPDLRRYTTDLRFARRLIGTVHFHSRHHEGTVSASDLVLVIRKPITAYSQSPERKLVVSEGGVRALFAQAKLGRPAANGSIHWGQLTENQIERFPAMLDFMTLFLYRWRDSSGTELEPLTWQPCRAHTIVEVEEWLSQDAFPTEMTSEAVIRGLTVGSFGTDNRRLVDEFAEEHGAKRWSVLEIRLAWPPGDVPPNGVSISFPRETLPSIVSLR